MTQDDDGFEPRLGRPGRDQVMASPSRSRQRHMLDRVARAGGNPRRLTSVVGPARRSAGGRFNARGRGARVAASLPRSSGWSLDRISGQRIRMRRVTVKARIVKGAGKAGAAAAHLHYLEREGTTREGGRGTLFSTFSDEADRDAFLERGVGDRHQFRLIVAPEDGARLDDLKPFTRDLMAQLEQDLGTTLDWVAIAHHDTGHPHVHIVVRGVTEDGKALNIAGDYIAHGIRHRASELVTRDLGWQSEQEVMRQLGEEVRAERLTRLDRMLLGRAGDGLVDLSAPIAADGADDSLRPLLVARARQLERMGLAERQGPLCWRLSPEMEERLDAMGRRGDIIRTLHQAMRSAGVERSTQAYRIRDPGKDGPIVGRVIARGLSDEAADRRYLVIDGIDGHSHYADIGEASGRFPIGSVVRLSSSSIEPRGVDRTVVAVAGAHDRRYSVDLHLRQDRQATESFAQAHVRRLEAIRRATGKVEREPDGTWRIARDHLETVRAYERQRARREPAIVETLSPVPLSVQVEAEAPTWLDRQLVGEQVHDLATHGYGRDVGQALQRRLRWLVGQGLAEGEGAEARIQRGMIATLKRRELLRVAGELSDELGRPFAEAVAGEAVAGVCSRAVDLQGGRVALIERSRDFTLVPWRPVLERHIGREVVGLPTRDSISWTIGRGRGLSR